MWTEIIPDTIFLTEQYDTIIMAGICQNHIVEDYSYKGFALYYSENNTLEQFDTWRIYHENKSNCHEAYIPNDSLVKYHINKLGIRTPNIKGLSCNYSLIEKKDKMKELGALFEYEYKIKFDIIDNKTIIFSDTLQFGSYNKDWKKVKPVEIYKWITQDYTCEVVLIKYQNYYLDDEKRNHRDRIDKLIKMKCP